MNKWIKKDHDFVWHPFTQMKTEKSPLYITKADQSYLFDSEGIKYLDCNSSWWTNILGHNNKKIRKAINKQFKKVDHIIFANATHKAAIKLAEKIVKLTPDNLNKVFFSDNGSTAVEVALKMVFQYWYNQENPKTRIVAMNGAYHGDTFGAMSLGQRGYFNVPFENLFFDVDFLEFPHAENEEKILRNAEEIFKSQEIGGLILEPLIQGSAGMKTYSTSFLERLCALARRYKVLVIFDEVMTAWYRTGKLFAMDHCEFKPDIVCLSKGLTGGVLPLGLTVASNEIFDAFLHESKQKALLHGHSFTGNALSCAAALASIKQLTRKETTDKIEMICSKQKAFATRLQKEPNVLNSRVLGTIVAFELEKESQDYFVRSTSDVHKHFLSKGMFLRTLGNTIYLNPPYSFTEEQLEYCYKEILAYIR